MAGQPPFGGAAALSPGDAPRSAPGEATRRPGKGPTGRAPTEAAPRRRTRPRPRPPRAAPRRRRTRRRPWTRPQAPPGLPARRTAGAVRPPARWARLPRSPSRRRSSRRPAPRATRPPEVGGPGPAPRPSPAWPPRPGAPRRPGPASAAGRSPPGRVAQEERVVVGGSRPSGQHLDPRREVALDAHAVGLLRGAEPQHVALADGGLALHRGRVHVESARRVRVVHDRLVEVRPDPGVDGADAGEVHDQVAVGIGADQDLGDDFLGVVAAAVEGASEHGERDEAQLRVGHRWILGTSITAGQGILVTPPRRRAAARGTP